MSAFITTASIFLSIGFFMAFPIMLIPIAFYVVYGFVKDFEDENKS